MTFNVICYNLLLKIAR